MHSFQEVFCKGMGLPFLIVFFVYKWVRLWLPPFIITPCLGTLKASITKQDLRGLCVLCGFFQQHRVSFLSHDHSFAHDKISRLSFCLIPCVEFLVFKDKGNSNPKKGVLWKGTEYTSDRGNPRIDNEGKSWILRGWCSLKGYILFFFYYRKLKCNI